MIIKGATMNPLTSLHVSYVLTPEAEAHLARWDQAMALEPPTEPTRWHYYLWGYLRSATVAASTQIEGNPLSLPEVDALLQGESVNAPDRLRQEPINYNNALSTAQSLALVDSFEWSEAILRMLNAQVLFSDPDNRQGRYRDEQVNVGGGVYSAPDWHLVPNLMAELVEWLQRSTDPTLIRVALLHLNLVAIHPWINGNGRTARVASSLELMRSHVNAPELVNVEPYLRSHQDEYFAQLRETLGATYDPERHTASAWVNYYIRVSAERLGFDARMQDAWPLDLGVLVDALGSRGDPAEWATFLLLAAIAPVRTRWLADAFGRPMSTLRSMLAAMENHGWLIHHGRTRARHYAQGPRLSALTLRTPEIVRHHVEGQTTLGLEVA